LHIRPSHIQSLEHALFALNVNIQLNSERLSVSKGDKILNIQFLDHPVYQRCTESTQMLLWDYFLREPEKLAAHIQSKLGLNERVFARKCEVRRISKIAANDFLNRYHFMNSTQCAFAYGLHSDDKLLAVATFSKGRKMNRLKEHERSYELIRFCCKGGITITGGLSKLIKAFEREKAPGDIMTYVDRLLSEGEAFKKAGFKNVQNTAARKYGVHKLTGERELFSESIHQDEKKYFVMIDAGNVKMIYTPSEKT